jgi:hypothetical protein
LILAHSPRQSAAVVAEGVARSKASHAKQELTRVKAMSAAQVTTTIIVFVIDIIVVLYCI